MQEGCICIYMYRNIKPNFPATQRENDKSAAKSKKTTKPKPSNYNHPFILM